MQVDCPGRCSFRQDIDGLRRAGGATLDDVPFSMQLAANGEGLRKAAGGVREIGEILGGSKGWRAAFRLDEN